MRKSLACRLLLLLCCLAWLAGCRESATNNSAAPQDADPEAVVLEINSFVEELLGKVDAASDPAVGVDEAQAFFDARKPQLKSRIEAARASRKYREDREVQGKFLDCEVDNRERVRAIRKLHLERWARDAAFQSKLSKLEGDYQDLFETNGP